MLNLYVSNTALLLQNPPAPTTLYSNANLTTFVNTARTQLAGQTECIRATVSLTLVPGNTLYSFGSVTALPTGVQGIYNVRQATYKSGPGQVYMGSRPYPWALTYWLNNPSPTAGPPSEWSQYGIGVAGSLLINPPPSNTFTALLDVSCEPIILATDTDPEVIPYAYQDAVPYMAAYYAYMSAQRQQDAQTMLQRYEDFVRRAQMIAVPNVLPMQYDQHHEAPPTPQQGGGG